MEASEYLRPKAFRNNAINFKLKLRFECFFLRSISGTTLQQTEKINETEDVAGRMAERGKKCENDNGRHRFQFPFGIFFI